MCIHDAYFITRRQRPGKKADIFLQCPITNTFYQLLETSTYIDEDFVLLLVRKPDNSTVYHMVEPCLCPEGLLRVNLSRGG